jgi:hypothetical protein
VTTIDLPPELERVLRPWKGTNPDMFTQSDKTLSRLANLLPDPPYVPAVGDKVRAYWLEESGTARDFTATYQQGEEVLTVTDTYVITIDPSDSANPDVWSYRIDAHRFEKVEQ